MGARHLFNRESAKEKKERKERERREALNRPNRHGTNLFFKAVESGKLSEVAQGLREGADIMARTTQRGFFSSMAASTPYNIGATPLHAACLLGSPDIVSFLIEKGADPEAKDDAGHTPLDYAILGHGYYQSDLAKKESSRFVMQRFVDRAADRVEKFEQIIEKLLSCKVQPAMFEMPEKFKASSAGAAKSRPQVPPLP